MYEKEMMTVKSTVLTLGMLVLGVSLSAAQPSHASRPNVIFILTDDFGWGDLGVYYQNHRAELGLPAERTPQLDRLAAFGLQLRDDYCPAPVCGPSRASILLGLSQGHANVRDNQFDKALANNYTLGSVMDQAGYTTIAIGKWGEQGHERGEDSPATWPAFPTKRGFNYFFGYARHDDCHEHYPKEAKYAGGKSKQLWNGTEDITPGLDKCYTADLWTAYAKHWIVDYERTNSGKPFFMYLAYDTPHAVQELPTQAYPAGGGLHGGLQWLGTPGHMINTASGEIDSWVNPLYRHADWPDVAQRYATAITRIDSAVGDIQKLLEDLHLDKDTLVVFTSDNGPSIESYVPHEPLRADFFDSFGPFDGIKRDCWEGGVRMPTLVWWPGHVPAGGVITRPSIAYDWLPTFLAAAGLPAPAVMDGVSLLPELTGEGTQLDRGYLYVEYYEGGRVPDYQAFAPAHRDMERGQMQAIRMGDYMGVRYNVQSPQDPFQIFRVDEDTHQATNLLVRLPEAKARLGPLSGPGAAETFFPKLEQTMQNLALQVRRPNASAPRPYDHLPVPPSRTSVPTNGMVTYAVYEGDWPWVPEFTTMPPLKTGWTKGINLEVRPQKQHYGILFEGYIHAQVPGNYTFYLEDDGGAILRVHDATVIDNDFNHVDWPGVQADIHLAAGWHSFRLYYRHETGPANLSLKLAGPGFAAQPIPLTALAPAGPATAPLSAFDHFGIQSEWETLDSN
jgi:arylsulfatase A-like enzyme